MCFKVDCGECGKPTWKGCGKHIEECLKDVPVDERCKCREKAAAPAPAPAPAPEQTTQPAPEKENS